jgi:hypothetical protein
MTIIHSLTLLFFITILFQTNAQWYIIKKDYPSNLMNYPNPGKRSISDAELNLLNIDCSIPYSYLTSYQEKTAWLFSCSQKKSPLTTVDDSSSSSDLNNVDDNLYSTPKLILHERRTPRFIPPYLNEHDDVFNTRLLKRLRRSYRNQ